MTMARFSLQRALHTCTTASKTAAVNASGGTIPAHGSISGDGPQGRAGLSPSVAPSGGERVFALQRHVVDGLLDGAPLENTVGAQLGNMEIEDSVYAAAATGRTIDLT